MKILFAAVFDSEGISSNTSQAKGFAKLGHQTLLYNYRVRALQLGENRARDLEIIDVCKNENPDLVVFAKCNDVSLGVLQKCKKIAKVCYWFPDSLWAYLNHPEFVEKTAASDFFCCDKLNVLKHAEKYNNNCFLVPDGFDADIEQPKLIEKDIDISFIGSIYGDRQEKLQKLEHSVSVFSNAFGDLHSEVVSRSKINLNFCTKAGASDRVYKILGAAGFLISDDWVGRESMFEDGKDLVIYKDVDDLNDKIKFYLKNPKDASLIAQGGRITVQKYSRDNWARQIVEAATQ